MSRPLADVVATLLGPAQDRVVVPADVRTVLAALATEASWPPLPGAAALAGTARATSDVTVAGFATVRLGPTGPAVPFRLVALGPADAPSGFRLDLEPPPAALALPDGCRPAQVTGLGDRRGLLEVAGGGRVGVRPLGPAPLVLRVEGSEGGTASARLVVADADAGAARRLALDPPAFLVGTQGFGFHLPDGLAVEAVPGASGAATLARGELFLPPATPMIGAGPLVVDLRVGLDGGLTGRATTRLAAAGARPAVDVDVRWDDPLARSLDAAVPTSVELGATFPLGSVAVPAVGVATLEGARAVRVTGRLARAAGGLDVALGLTVAPDGPGPLLALAATDDAGRAVVGGTAFATAFLGSAEAPPAGAPSAVGGTSVPAWLGAVAAAGAALAGVVDAGRVQVDALELEGTLGAGGGTVVGTADVVVEVGVKPVDLGVAHVEMDPRAPMKVRYRGVRVAVDLGHPSPASVEVALRDARVVVEDPGGWRVRTASGLRDLFDVVSTRSGHGSAWVELDLRFALDLGPVRVDGATLRFTLGAGGAVAPELRGLGASLDVPGVASGRGRVSFGGDTLHAALAARLDALGVAAFARLAYRAPAGGGAGRVAVALGVDLPGPIPFANSGLGLFSVGGVLGWDVGFPPPTDDDPDVSALAFDPLEPAHYADRPGARVVGLAAIVGTAPDLGFAFHGRAVVALTLPDLALRASLRAGVLTTPRAQLGDAGDAGGDVGTRIVGALTVAADGVRLALRAGHRVPWLFELEAPFAGWFPTARPATWTARLGSDGVLGRGPGPVRVTVLPELLRIGAEAWLMLHGDGIPSLGGRPELSPRGFSLGFGARFRTQLGVAVVYAEVSASLDVALGSHPLLVAGAGRVAGRLHLGPVSVGVDAALEVGLAPALGDRYLRAELCGEVDLFFDTLRGCVGLEVGARGDALPEVDESPLETVALADARYVVRHRAAPTSDGGRPGDADLPVVWPDVVPVLGFRVGPAPASVPVAPEERGPFLDTLPWDPARVGTGVVGDDRTRCIHELEAVRLLREDPHGVLGPVPGPLPAAWQLSPGTLTGQPGARELALLRWDRALWARARLDGAAGTPDDPAPVLARGCRDRPVAAPAWALGGDARRGVAPGRWRVPSEPTSDPFGSVFEVRVAATWSGVPLTPAAAAALPLAVPVRLLAPLPLPADEAAEGRGFSTSLALPCVVGIPPDLPGPFLSPYLEAPVVVRLAFSEPVHDPAFVWRLPAVQPLLAKRLEDAVVLERGGASFAFPHEDAVAADGVGVVRVHARAGGPFDAIRVSLPAVVACALLGVRAVTASARRRADASARATDAASAPPPAAPGAGGAAAGTSASILAPDTVHCVEVVTASRVVRRRPDGSEAHGPRVRRTQRAWFRTASPRTTGALPSGTYPQGVSPDAARAAYDEGLAATAIRDREDRFDPTWLARYVLGWMPRDGATAWFADDPVAVTLAVDHVEALAAAYDHETVVTVRRFDPPHRPAGAGPVTTSVLTERLPGAVSALHPASEVRRHLLAGAAAVCPQPPPGATLGGRAPLETSASYELHLGFPRRRPPGTPPSFVHRAASVRGGVFSTSRWRTPDELLRALGFREGAAAGPPVVGVAVPAVAVAAGVHRSDLALEDALARLGLGRRPRPSGARATALWADVASAWALVGVLLEAPEPIHRDASLGWLGFHGRLRLGALRVTGRTLAAVHVSAAGDRLLYLATQPVTAPGDLALHVTQQAIPTATLPRDVESTWAARLGPPPERAPEAL